MRNFTLKLTKSYKFDVNVDANSIEDAKKIIHQTPFEKGITDCKFSDPELRIKDVVCNDLDSRFYKDDNKLR